MPLSHDPARLRVAALVALVVPALLYGGALVSQYGFGLYPCEMCYWQRWPHEAAAVAALLALALLHRPVGPWLVLAAAVGILTSGGIGVFHAGVEYGWWAGLTACSAPAGAGSGNFMRDIMAAPVIRCDAPQWTFAGVSLAGFNAIFSGLGAIAVLILLRRAMSGRTSAA